MKTHTDLLYKHNLMLFVPERFHCGCRDQREEETVMSMWCYPTLSCALRVSPISLTPDAKQLHQVPKCSAGIFIIIAPPTQWDYLQEPAFPKDRQIRSSPNATWDAHWLCIHTAPWQTRFCLEMFTTAFPCGPVDDTKTGGFGCLLDWNISPQESQD